MDGTISRYLAEAIALGETYNCVCLNPVDAKGRKTIDTEHGSLTILCDPKMPVGRFWLGWWPGSMEIQ